jgi:hypothetical protein
MGLFNVKEENLAAAAGALSLSLSFLSLIPWVPSCKFQFQWRLRLLYYMAATERRERARRRPANTFISPQNNHRRLLLCCLTRCARTAPSAPASAHTHRARFQMASADMRVDRPSGLLFYGDVIKSALGTG